MWISWNARRAVSSLAAMTLLGAWNGCAGLPPFEPSALEGTWLVNAEADRLTQMLVTFDQTGRLVKVTYQIGSFATVEETNTTGRGTIDGDNVTIEATFGTGRNTLHFEGSINAAHTQIEGEVTTEIRLLGVRITINSRPATLTEQ